MYQTIAPQRFLLGAVIVTAPLLLIEDDTWQWRYVLLILVMYTVYNARGLQSAAAYVGRALG